MRDADKKVINILERIVSTMNLIDHEMQTQNTILRNHLVGVPPVSSMYGNIAAIALEVHELKALLSNNEDHLSLLHPEE